MKSILFNYALIVFAAIAVGNGIKTGEYAYVGGVFFLWLMIELFTINNNLTKILDALPQTEEK